MLKRRYTYRPLDVSRHVIRLLIIEPKNPSISGLPLYRLTDDVLLDDGPEYETISYCWGSPVLNSTVVVDNGELHITDSAATILTRLALPNQPRVIWIDAICINQNEILEKSHQVPLMKRIYAQGSCNIIYLGEGDDKTLCGLEVIRNTSLKLQGGESADFEALTTIEKDALVAFFSLPWFTRVWVVQEVVLAKENICTLGDSEIDFEDISIFLGSLASVPAFNISQMFQGLIGAMSATTTLGFRHLLRNGQPLSLRLALAATAPLKCTDMRDKVYGVLGMCTEHMSAAEEAETNLLQVDYTKSYQDVLRDTTRYTVWTSQPNMNDFMPHVLRWISFRAGAELYDPKLPSWVPRVDREGDFELDDASLTISTITTIPPDQDWVSRDIENPNILELHGTLIGRIKHISAIFTPSILSSSPNLRHLISEVDATASSTCSPQTLTRTLIADTNYESHPSTEEDLNGYKDMLKVFDSNQHVLRLADVSRNLSKSDMAATCYFEALIQACRNRRFVVTDAGDIGLAPQITEIGDTVVSLLADCGGVPYVLRAVGKEFKMVGACYVDGFMPGQEMPRRLGERKLFAIS